MDARTKSAEGHDYSRHDERAERRRADWTNRPLCCRYLFAQFKYLRLHVRSGDAVQHADWYWALGLFVPDKLEVLGAWPIEVAARQIAEDLHDRGIERIGVVSAGCPIDLTSRFPEAITWQLADGPLALAPRQRLELRSAIDAAKQLQKSIEGSIKRRSPFPDKAAATSFLTLALEKANRRLLNGPKNRCLENPRPAIEVSSRLVAASHRN